MSNEINEAQLLCPHEHFEAEVKVGRILAGDGSSAPRYYQADIVIRCADCDLPFSFKGVEH